MNRRSFLGALAALPIVGKLPAASAPAVLSHTITPMAIGECDCSGSWGDCQWSGHPIVWTLQRDANNHYVWTVTGI